MRIIEPLAITPSMMTASNIPEDDYPAWNVGSTYANGDRVIHEHGVWESVQANNVGKNPLNSPTWWYRISATNRWRAFDNRLGGMVTGGASITYSIALTRTLNALCFFGLNAQSLQVRVIAPGPNVIHDETVQLASREPVGNAWEYRFNQFTFKGDLVMTGIFMPSGSTVELTITGGTATQVGEIFLGNDMEIGVTLTGTSLGIQDFSKKEPDEFGGVFIVPRPVIDIVNFRFSAPKEGSGRIQSIIRRITSKVCVFYAFEGEDTLGTTVAGLLRDYDLDLDATRAFGSLRAESLV